MDSTNALVKLVNLIGNLHQEAKVILLESLIAEQFSGKNSNRIAVMDFGKAIAEGTRQAMQREFG